MNFGGVPTIVKHSGDVDNLRKSTFLVGIDELFEQLVDVVIIINLIADVEDFMGKIDINIIEVAPAAR